jgi:hypothetical protein
MKIYPKVVTPRMFQSGVQPEFACFPLKACGNDELSLTEQAPLRSEMREIKPAVNKESMEAK